MPLTTVDDDKAGMIEIHDPATGDRVGAVAMAGREEIEAGLAEAGGDGYGLAATVLTASMAHAQHAWRELPVGTVKVNAVFGGAPGGAVQPRRRSGNGYGYGPELLDEMTQTKVVHLALAGTA